MKTPIDALRDVLRRLRRDPEEVVAPWLGDAAAHRLGQAASSFADWQRDAFERLVENVLEYVVDERHLAVQRPEFQALARDIDTLNGALERLEERVTRLEG